jgi:hypothetical protein
MNLKDFKKVHEDENKAILQNKKGHSFTIAKKALSPKHREDLKALKLHAADGTMIDPSSLINQGPDNSDLDKYTLGQLQQQPAAQPDQSQQDTEETEEPEEITPRTPAQQPAPTQTQPQAQEPSTPDAQTAEGAYNDYFNKNAAYLGEQTAKFTQDLSNGHIEPKTYQQLFNEKSLPGKIGTLFGLMISGAGSGLTHQPNAVMKMMDTEIANDLDAQKQSKTNAQNFLKINNETMMNRAKIQNLGQSTAKEKIETQGEALKNKLAAQQLSLMQMKMSLFHGLTSDVDKIPDNSPLKQRAVQSTTALGQQVHQSIQQGNEKTAAQIAAISQAEYVAKTNKMRVAGTLGGEPGFEKLAEDREKKMIPDIGYADREVPQEKIDRLTGITNYQGRLNEYKQLADKISGVPIANWSPTDRQKADAIRSDLISGYNDVKGLKRFTGNEEELYNKIIPDIKKMDLANFFGGAKENIGNLAQSVQRIKDQEFKSAGVHPFSDAGSLGGQPGSKPEFDPKYNAYYIKVPGGRKRVSGN